MSWYVRCVHALLLLLVFVPGTLCAPPPMRLAYVNSLVLSPHPPLYRIDGPKPQRIFGIADQAPIAHQYFRISARKYVEIKKTNGRHYLVEYSHATGVSPLTAKTYGTIFVPALFNPLPLRLPATRGP